MCSSLKPLWNTDLVCRSLPYYLRQFGLCGTLFALNVWKLSGSQVCVWTSNYYCQWLHIICGSVNDIVQWFKAFCNCCVFGLLSHYQIHVSEFEVHLVDGWAPNLQTGHAHITCTFSTKKTHLSGLAIGPPKVSKVSFRVWKCICYNAKNMYKSFVFLHFTCTHLWN